MKDVLRHAREFARMLTNGRFYPTRGGILFPAQGVLAHGVYHHGVNGAGWRADCNLIPDQGLVHVLQVAFGGTNPVNGWYLALFTGNVTPSANLTAANFAATVAEITASSEGYSQATRPQWAPSAAADGAISNLANKAQFAIAATSTVEITGAGLLSDNAKGSTAGVLASAARFAQTRTVYDGDTFDLGYEVRLTDS